jgi:SAM-dependent methyltransferase
MPHAPYRLLARHYGEVLPGIEGMNAHAREEILRGRWGEIRSVCELGAGPGATAVALARRGLAVTALDNSLEFCRQIRARAESAGVKVRVVRGDMRCFRLPRSVDLVLCEFAALAHLDRHAELARVLACAARALRPGGLLLFDVNTTAALLAQAGHTYWVDSPRFKLVQRGVVRHSGRRVELTFDWFVPLGGARRGTFRHVREEVVNLAWSRAELVSALGRAGFASVRTFDGVDVRPKMPGAKRGFDLYVLARRR